MASYGDGDGVGGGGGGGDDGINATSFACHHLFKKNFFFSIIMKSVFIYLFIFQNG